MSGTWTVGRDKGKDKEQDKDKDKDKEQDKEQDKGKDKGKGKEQDKDGVVVRVTWFEENGHPPGDALREEVARLSLILDQPLVSG